VSWLHPDTATLVRSLLRGDRKSWQELFTDRGEPDLPELAPPEGIDPGSWPKVARHVARAERVREVVDQHGPEIAERQFRTSPHAVERASLLTALHGETLASDLEPVVGVLACDVDEWVAYGPFLARLVELGLERDPALVVVAYEQFVAASSAIRSTDASWPERVRGARGGLAAVYTRVHRGDDADAIYRDLHLSDPTDTTVSIGAARAFLEVGETARSIGWLETARTRAIDLGRAPLAQRLGEKVAALRGRLN
jgi:hypothetical protein